MTTHQVGSHDAWFIGGHDLPTSALVLWVFGEIDVRCHLGKIAVRDEVPRLAFVQNLVRRCLHAIRGKQPAPPR